MPVALSRSLLARGWSDFLYVATGLPLGIAWLILLVTLLSVGLGLALITVGIPILAIALLLWRWGANTERERAALVLGAPIARPQPREPRERRGCSIAGSPACATARTWRDLGYMLLLGPGRHRRRARSRSRSGRPPFAALLAPVRRAVGAGRLGCSTSSATRVADRRRGRRASRSPALAALVTRGLAAGCASLAQTLLADDDRAELEQRISSLEATRSGAVDSADARLRRIERDLHDGAQHRLAYIAMELGRARAKLATDPGSVDALLAGAHDESKVAMRELRDLVRGIHPSVLSDRGLDAALSGLAERASVPVEIRGSLERPAPARGRDRRLLRRRRDAHERRPPLRRRQRATSSCAASSDELVLDDPRRRPRRRAARARLRPRGPRPARRGARRHARGRQPRRRPHHDRRAVAMRVVIAEDLVLLREGLASLLADNGHEVVAGVGDGEALLAALEEHRPDLAIVDVRMPPTQTDEGVRAAVEARRRRPDAAILILSQYVEERYASDLLSSGARGIGYLLKDRVADVQEFVAAAARVAAGGTVIDPEVVAQLIGRRPSARSTRSRRARPRCSR